MDFKSYTAHVFITYSLGKKKNKQKTIWPNKKIKVTYSHLSETEGHC